ncbi:MAG: hypothetical protein ABFE08_17805 [Armatimonadia bacterium]
MFSSIDKALAALVMAVLFLINYFFGVNLSWVSQDTVATVIGLLMPVLVWAVPNKAKPTV